MQPVFACLLISLCTIAGARAEPFSNAPSAKVKIVEPWRDSTIKLLQLNSSGSRANHSKARQVHARRAIYEFTQKLDPATSVLNVLSVLKVHNTITKTFCFVDGQDSFYIADARGTRGYTVGPGVLNWSGSYYETPLSGGAAVAAFENYCDRGKMERDRLNRAETNRIDLRAAVSEFYFSDAPAPGGAIVAPEIGAIEMSAGILKLEMRNPITRVPAILWIDLENKLIVKSIVNGRKMDLKTNQSAQYYAVPSPGVQHTPWTPFSIKLYQSVGNRTTAIPARRSVYQYEVGTFGTTFIPVVAFVSGPTQTLWIGPEQDFYVRTESSVSGVKLDGGLIFWHDSIILEPDQPGVKIDSLIRQFEDEINPAMLNVGPGGGDLSPPPKHMTDLRPVFQLWAFTNGKYSSEAGHDIKIISIELAGGELYLKLENSASAFSGEVWINPRTRTVTKAIEAGKRMFP